MTTLLTSGLGLFRVGVGDSSRPAIRLRQAWWHGEILLDSDGNSLACVCGLENIRIK
jgi:hypothetical protein